MQIALHAQGQQPVINEFAPILVFALAFVIAVGGAYALALSICGYGHINMASVDFWKAQVKIQCK